MWGGNSGLKRDLRSQLSKRLPGGTVIGSGSHRMSGLCGEERRGFNFGDNEKVGCVFHLWGRCLLARSFIPQGLHLKKDIIQARIHSSYEARLVIRAQ